MTHWTIGCPTNKIYRQLGVSPINFSIVFNWQSDSQRIRTPSNQIYEAVMQPERSCGINPPLPYHPEALNVWRGADWLSQVEKYFFIWRSFPQKKNSWLCAWARLRTHTSYLSFVCIRIKLKMSLEMKEIRVTYEVTSVTIEMSLSNRE